MSVKRGLSEISLPQPQKVANSSVINNDKRTKIEANGTTSKTVLVKQKVHNSEWNFEVDYNDHFETPQIAYQDLLPVLASLAAQLGKTSDKLIIYDPYWCKGNMVSRLAQLGYSNVINRNRDFYKDIKNKQLPGIFRHK
jgi:hypothetical protein